jgi:mono/diheme cytochrome c family protein
VACTEHEFEPPDQEARVRQADSLYAIERWDTIAWLSDSMRAFEGNVVFSSYCRRCHGPLGEGGTEYAAERELEVPSLVEPDWRWADQPDSVRHRIYVGHAHGMPIWGVAGITLREIDAASYYLLEVLRPEVLGSR